MPAGSLASKVTLNGNLHAAADLDVFAIPMLDGSFFELVVSPDADDASLTVEVDNRIFQAGPGEPIYVPRASADAPAAAEPIYVHVQSDLAANYTMDVVQNAMQLPTDRGVEVVDISQSAINIDNGTRYAAVLRRSVHYDN